MIRKTKRELILEIFEAEGFQELSDTELEVINVRLKEIHGRGGVASPGYIASTLLAAGKRISYKDELPASVEDLQENSLNFAGMLSFDNLSAAEISLRQIDKFFRKFHAEGDEEGIMRCREMAKRARLRAQLLADNDKVAPERRAEKTEIAFWFDIWLGTPDLFEDWLALRKSSRDFCDRFGPLDDNNGYE